MGNAKTDLNFQNDPKQLFPGGDWSEAGQRPFFVQISIPNTHRTWHNHPDETSIRPRSWCPLLSRHALVRRDIANGLEELEIADAASAKSSSDWTTKDWPTTR